MEQFNASSAADEKSKDTMAEPDKKKNIDADPSSDMDHWNKDQVREWALTLEGVNNRAADVLFEQDITGPSLMLLETKDLIQIGVKLGPAKVIIHARDEIVKLKKEQPESLGNKPGRTCKPYPFNRYHDTYRYVEGDILGLSESGASNFIDPCHEYKAFTKTTEETTMTKFTFQVEQGTEQGGSDSLDQKCNSGADTYFTSEVIRFAAACMNSRTNGTIHFGIGDVKQGFTHGQVLGVVVKKNREIYNETLRIRINQCFEFKHKDVAQICIKPPRFVGVLNNNMTTSEKFVIEVDIVSDSSLCQDNIYHTIDCNKKKKKSKAKEIAETDPRQFFVRKDEGTKNLLAPTTNAKPMFEYNKFVSNVPQLKKLRMQSEEERLREVKSHQQGLNLCQMITGGTGSLDKSYYEHYIIVTNKSHPAQLDSLDFLVEVNPIAVLDFDPQSFKNGLCERFEKKSPVTIHSPDKYTITESVFDIANDLHLTRSTSWVFCNGKTGVEQPSEINHWMVDKGASVRNVISFLCRKDVLRNKKFLVVFLLWSRVNDKMDPLVETFCTFYQELKGTEQIICICDNENAFMSWKNLIDARCEVDISNRCIYELSFSEVNGTILSLLSENRRSRRFLPGAGGSKVALEKKMERQLTTLDVLCVNQCEGGNEDKDTIEQTFYRGGEVSWWNFYFSELPGSMPFIKRDKFDYIIESLIPGLCSLRKACVLFNLLHIPGCGGTTLAEHVLWTLRKKFRCALLIDNDADPETVAEHVVELLKCGCTEQETPLSVLLMIDDFEDMEKVFSLQQLIEKQCLKSNIQSRSPLVILLNCMRSEYNSGPYDPTEDTVFIGNNLTEDEQKQFDQKRAEMEKTFTPAKIETFYGFMMMKKNFCPEYFQSVVQHTLQSFDMEQKHTQLLAVLVLMSVYCKHAGLSVSLCEEYLCSQKPYYGEKEVEEGFKKFSTLIWSCDIQAKVSFKGVRMIHSQIAQYCLKELNLKHKFSKAELANFLLTTNDLYCCTQGKDKLMQDVRDILVKRYSLEQESQSQALLATSTRPKPDSCSEKDSTCLGNSEDKKADSRFSPLIQDIERETPGFGEDVLIRASGRFQKDPIISQLLTRYYYLKKKDFDEAKRWAKTAKRFSPNSSYISDTAAQVIKHELKHAIANTKWQSIDHEALRSLLKLARSAVDAFRETQKLAVHESIQRLQTKRDFRPLNVVGFLGEVQVCVHIIEVLEKIPLFSAGGVRHDIMCSVLSGSINLDQMKERDPEFNNYIQFYRVLQEFAEMMYNVKLMMKSKFDFFDKFNVHLSSKFGMKESRDQIVQSELSRCFRKFAQLFCKTESEHLLNKNMNRMLKLHKARQLIEMEKVDTYSGILNCLSKNTKPEVLGEIISAYKLVCNSNDCSPIEKINYIYINVVVSCINLKLIDEPYQRLVTLLCQCLGHPAPRVNLPLYFIAVLLLWPQLHLSRAESVQLRGYISHMKTAFHTEMKDIYNGKKAIVHFFLGKKRCYERIVHLGEIKRRINAGPEQFASKWQNGTIWKNPKVQELLCRVTGQVHSRSILAHTCSPDLKVEVTPLFPSQLRGYKEGSTVSFFIGFSMQGPLAIDIDESEVTVTTLN